MTIQTLTLQLNTRGNADMADITDQVAACLNDSGLTAGIVTIFCPSSTSALTTIEYESGALNDLKRLFEFLEGKTDNADELGAGEKGGSL